VILAFPWPFSSLQDAGHLGHSRIDDAHIPR
jgi:hypothetical protein